MVELYPRARPPVVQNFKSSLESTENFQKLAQSLQILIGLSILAIRSNRQQETVLTDKYSLISQNSAVIFGFQLMRKHVLAFSKDGK